MITKEMVPASSIVVGDKILIVSSLGYTWEKVIIVKEDSFILNTGRKVTIMSPNMAVWREL